MHFIFLFSFKHKLKKKLKKIIYLVPIWDRIYERMTDDQEMSTRQIITCTYQGFRFLDLPYLCTSPFFPWSQRNKKEKCPFIRI